MMQNTQRSIQGEYAAAPVNVPATALFVNTLKPITKNNATAVATYVTHCARRMR